VRLGRTDLAVTKICFGTSALGDMPDTYGYGVDEERARETVRAVFASPVDFLDTSRIYGFGRSEERIGAVIRERGGLPEGLVISTKLDRDPDTNRWASTALISCIFTIRSTQPLSRRPRARMARSRNCSRSGKKDWRRQLALLPARSGS
jgi:aryl-alcohol dehydrogenase-like predicted oxidoreductase